MSAQSAPSSDHTASRPGPSYFAPDLEVTGRITSSGDLEIDGQVNGTVDATRLKVGPHGRVRAALAADDAVVSGKVVGVLKARGVTFTDGCHFTGEVQYEQIGMQSAAEVEGRLHPVIDGNARTNVGQTVQTTPAPAGPAVSGRKAAARPVPHIPRHVAAVEPVAPTGHPVLKGLVVATVLIAAAVVGALYISPAARDWRAALVESVREAKPAAGGPVAAPNSTPEAPTESTAGAAPTSGADSGPAEAGAPPAGDQSEPAKTAIPTAPPKPPPPAAPEAEPEPKGADTKGADTRGAAPAPAEPPKAQAPTAQPSTPAPALAPPPPPPPATPPKADPAPPRAATPPPPAQPAAQPPKTTGGEGTKAEPKAVLPPPEPAAKAEPQPQPPKTAPARPATPKPAQAPVAATPPAPVAEPSAPAPEPPPPPQQTAPATPAPAPPTAGGRGAKPEEDGCQWVKQCAPEDPERCVSVRRCDR